MIVCTKCGHHNDMPFVGAASPFDRCLKCGDKLAEQNLHVELSPPPYPKEPSMYPRAPTVTMHTVKGTNDEVDIVDEGNRGRIRVREPSGKASAFLTSIELDKLAEHCSNLAARLRERDRIQIVPAPRPVDDTSRKSWREQIAAGLSGPDQIDFAQQEWVPCSTCAAKPGAPTLCAGCLANRQTIAELREKLEEWRPPEGKAHLTAYERTRRAFPEGGEAARAFFYKALAEERAARKLNRLSNKGLAEYIIEWLQARNDAQLEDAFEDMRVRDWNTLHDELEAILEHGGKPPNWT